MMGRIAGGTAFDGKSGYVATGMIGNFGDALIAPDLDGDGYDELIIGTPNSDSFPAPGNVDILWGGPHSFPATFSINSYMQEDCKGFSIRGTTCEGTLGRSLASGDVDGDGISDLVMEALNYCGDNFTLYVFRGGARANFATMSLDMFSTAYGYKFTGLPNYPILYKVADLNNDKIADIIISDMPNERMDIIWGQLGGFPFETAMSSLTSPQSSIIVGPILVGGSKRTYFGSTFAIGDVNGDKKNDLIVGALNGNEGTGAVYGFTSFSPFRNASKSDFKIVCEETDDAHLGLGQGIGIGDITNDGINEMIICGNARVSQPDDRGLFTSYCAAILGKPVFAPPLNITALTSADGFYLTRGNGFFQTHECLGQDSKIDFIDVNDDGIKDLVIGDYCAEHAPGDTLGEFINNGSVTFILGQAGAQPGFLPTYDFAQLAFKDGWEWKGKEYNSLSYAMTTGDFNGDGKSDFVTSTPFSNPFTHNIVTALQSVYVAFGSSVQEGVRECTAAPVPRPEPEPFPYPHPHTSAASRMMLPQLFPKPLQHGGVKGASNVVRYALEAAGCSLTTQRLVGTTIYYGGVYTFNYCNRYNDLAINNSIPEAEKSTTAAYQALGDLGTLVVTQAVLTASGKLCHWLGKIAENKGWTRTSNTLNWLSQSVGYGSYAYQSYQQGVLPVAANIGCGMVVENVVTEVGKDVVDDWAALAQTYRKSNEAKLTFFSAAKTQKNAAMEKEVTQQAVATAKR